MKLSVCFIALCLLPIATAFSLFKICPILDCEESCRDGRVEVDGCETCTCVDICEEAGCGKGSDDYTCQVISTNGYRRTKNGEVMSVYRAKCNKVCPPDPVCDKKCYFGSELKDECPTCDCKDICKEKNVECPENFRCEVTGKWCVIGYCNWRTGCVQDVCKAGEPEVDKKGFRVGCKGLEENTCSEGFTCVLHSNGDGSCCPGDQNQLE
ncbi:hypothetical protein CAPTEDRAFT_189840 [Capitella teleta]|uniref:Antistasin-like domain-containing protein n=1 Tax=Capitella teleta TaxID=283909 RepID=R7VGI9_CAPTE|nr:hypothetical protein CAPTEDRAFT_189840 [Capitella teleta]|eukprot:ELU14805.1 hypothetical protein CAPTEDRAFT_189840 [Capitella teleta]